MNTSRLRLRHLASFTATCFALAGFVPALAAQTIYVDTSSDIVDFGGAQRVADLPGPDGRISLPEAGLASDNTAGVQTIGFHIPQNEWEYQQFFPGRAVLRPFLGFRVFDTAILDARTQTAFTGETNPTGGGEVVIWQESYLIDNYGGAAYGFDNSSFHLSGGAGNVLQGNTDSGFEVFESHANLIGGTLPGQGNTGGFIQIDRANDNVVVGNTVLRVRVLGWTANGQSATNNRIGGPTPAERNNIIGTGTWNSEGWPSGYAMQLFDTVGTVVDNNQIGTTPDGLQQGSQASTAGILFDGENYDTLIRNNRIAGILGRRIGTYPGVLGTGISVNGIGDGVRIMGNSIGLDANGLPLLGSVTGITASNYWLGPVRNLVIGGPGPGEGNEIAGHLDVGISIDNSFAGVRISGNSIHDNDGIGIDLITPGFLHGVTANDPGDADLGGNGLQNFPVLTAAFPSGGGTTVEGRFDSDANRSYVIEFFVSPAADATGYGEGAEFLGSTALSTDANGHANFSHTVAQTVPAGWFLSSTAMAAVSGDTSEFSLCVPVGGGILLTASPLQRGQIATLTVQRALPSERVTFLYSLNGVGPGICPPALGSLCLDLLSPVVNLGNQRADASGTATLSITVPSGAPLISVHLQAVARRGPGGSSSVKSNTVSTTILP